jgi:Tol biopolymer transport system component/DNA-binding winged helix-turn-helix (wHTH) protein
MPPSLQGTFLTGMAMAEIPVPARRLLRFGSFEFDLQSGELRKAGVLLGLQDQSHKVLVGLLERPGNLVTREQLRQRLWPDGTFVDVDHGLNAVINRLRETLGDSAESPRFIQTVPRRGYRFIAPVDDVAGTPPPGAPRGGKGADSWLSSGRRAVLVLLALAVGAATMWSVATDRRSVTGRALPAMTTRQLTSLAGSEGSPSFSPDGTRVTFHWQPGRAADSRIVVKSIEDDAMQELTRGMNDSYPAWSPDGRWIAFARDDGPRSGMYVVPAIGGPVRRLYAGSLSFGPSWSPDSRTLVFSATLPTTSLRDRDGLSRRPIFRLSLDVLEARQLTFPAEWDVSPAFSPDGRTIVFVREWAHLHDLYLVPAIGGEPRRLTFDNKAILGHPTWTNDGAAILFASSRAGTPEVWRVAVAGGTPERVPVAATAVADLALDHTGRRLAYVLGPSGRFAVPSSRAFDRMHISAFDLRNPASPPVKVAESSRRDHAATFSPDGKRIAFSSDRAGEVSNIWIADADGSNPVRLTHFEQGYTGSPRWSPDGEWVAFDSSSSEEEFDIFLVRSAGGAPRRLTGRGNDFGPSWSNDGKRIFFVSDRGGNDQVWKMSTTGAEPVQITRHGGGRALQSADGKWLYYTKSDNEGGIWRTPVHGGPEEPVLDGVPSGDYSRYWALVENGIYYLNTQDADRQSVEFYSFSTRRAQRLFDLPTPAGPDWSPSFQVSPDQRILLTVFVEKPETDIMLVDNFQSAPASERR